jgi:molybdenum cofactor cytidylyltransferase
MTDPRRTTAIVLAAGSASRFGAVKVLATLDGRPLLAHVLDSARAAGLGEVLLVVGAAADAVADAVDLGGIRIVVNPNPEGGLSSSLRLGLAALAPEVGIAPGVDAALVLLGDQPLVRPDVLRALLAADVPDGRSIVVPRYSGGGGANPALLLRTAWALAGTLTGDRGMGPIIAAHPEVVVEVPVDGTNPDVDTPGDLAILAWAARVRANRDQVDRVREVPDGDFYSATSGLFVADPRRSDAEDPTLAALRALARPGERWLDIGAGAGRYALPLALAVDRDGGHGEIVALDPSPAMLAGLRAGMTEHRISNVRVIEGRWPADASLAMTAASGSAGSANKSFDVALVAHVGYDVEAIGPFLDAMEASAGRSCVAVMMERTPASIAEVFWPAVHGEPRIPLPALPEFVELLRARRRDPEVRMVERTVRTFADREQALGLLRRQTWVAPGGARDVRLQALLDERLIALPGGGHTIRDVPPLEVGIVTWRPREG